MIAKRRNFGCRIYDQLQYKGLDFLILENEQIRISVLVGKGTDILSLLYKPKDVDFMWVSPKDFEKENLSSFGFLETYLGGWQEIIPNGGSPCIYKGASFDLHDESPLLSWQYYIISDNPGCAEVCFSANLRKSPLYIEKSMKILSGKPIIYIKERLVNRSDETLDFMWGHHPCFGEPFLSKDCVINFHADRILSNKTPISDNSFVKPDATGTLKQFPSIDGRTVDLSIVLDKNAHVCDLLYAEGLKDNWFSITNLKQKLGIGFVFDPEIFKYLYYWLVYGGSDGYPWYGSTYSLAIEPWSSYPGLGLTEAIKSNTALQIRGGQHIETWLNVVVFEKDTEVKKINQDLSVL